MVYAFDRFRWNSCFEGWVAGTTLEGKFGDGEDFFPAYLELITANQDLIHAARVDLEHAVWDGKPIRLLINDVWKNFQIAKSTATAYFPYLQQGAYLINQDYLWCTDALVQLIMYRFRNLFEPAYQVPNGNTVVFRCIERIDLDLMSLMPASLTDVSLAEIDEAVAWSKTFLNDTGTGAVELGKIWMHLEKGDREGAITLGHKLLESSEGNNAFVRWQVGILVEWGYGFVFF